MLLLHVNLLVHETYFGFGKWEPIKLLSLFFCCCLFAYRFHSTVSFHTLVLRSTSRGSHFLSAFVLCVLASLLLDQIRWQLPKSQTDIPAWVTVYETETRQGFTSLKGKGVILVCCNGMQRGNSHLVCVCVEPHKCGWNDAVMTLNDRLNRWSSQI